MTNLISTLRNVTFRNQFYGENESENRSNSRFFFLNQFRLQTHESHFIVKTLLYYFTIRSRCRDKNVLPNSYTILFFCSTAINDADILVLFDLNVFPLLKDSICSSTVCLEIRKSLNYWVPNLIVGNDFKSFYFKYLLLTETFPSKLLQISRFSNINWSLCEKAYS